jgi:hypothetical protein
MTMTSKALPLVISFPAAEKTFMMIGRKDELKKIKEAIFRTDDSLQVVFVRELHEAGFQYDSDGGYGKTRLLEEVIKRVGPDGEWFSGSVVVSDVIDLVDTRLHARNNFLRAVRERFEGQDRAGFPRYKLAFDRYQLARAYGADHHMVQSRVEEVATAFLEDYRENVSQRRLVWVLDAVEQLLPPGFGQERVGSEVADAHHPRTRTGWLARKLLTTEDLAGRTQRWLVEQIRLGALPKTTLILAGREQEAAGLFQEIENAVTGSNREAQLVDIRLKPFNSEETGEYILAAATTLEERAKQAQDTAEAEAYKAYKRAARDVRGFLNQPDLIKALWLQTGGIPIRLALSIEVLISDKTIDLPFRWPWDKLIQHARTDNPLQRTPELEKLQWVMEEGLIHLLFRRTDLRTCILKVLVCTRRGLTAEQLHFVLDNDEGLSPEAWEKVADRRRIQEIEDTFRKMSSLFLTRYRPPGWRDWDNPDKEVIRCGVQDVIYRIYAEHMAPQSPHIQLMDARLQHLWDSFTDNDRRRYKRNREDEKYARQKLYTKLRIWADYRYQIEQQRRREFQDEDERGLQVVSPDMPRSIQFKQITNLESERRLVILDSVREYELERMHYELLLSPEVGFNTEYAASAELRTWANEDEESDFLRQATMQRVLHDRDALRFIDLQSPPEMEHGESPLYVLYRAEQQEDAVRWIRHLLFRKDYRRAIDFTRDLEAEIDKLRNGDAQSRRDWASWNHTMAQADRLCWQMYAQILLGDDLAEAITSLQKSVDALQKLARHTVQEVAVSKDQASSGRDEHGFKGVLNSDGALSQEAHPAYLRLRWLISHIYNTLGQACISLGRIRSAVNYYKLALYYVRDHSVPALRAIILNNLAYALSEMGKRRGLRLCRDGLDLRKQVGAEVPIGYSHNMLAVIYNDLNEPDEGWLEAAKAVAYFRRASESRGLGLGLLELGQALRRMANQEGSGRVLQAHPDTIYRAAEDLLKEAFDIISNQTEPIRLIEAQIEWGCLHRDRIQSSDSDRLSSQSRAHYREALTLLERASAQADTHGFRRHALDARVNLAWTHYFAEQLEAAEQALGKAEATIDDSYVIRPISKDEPEGYVPNVSLLEEVYVFQQLSKAFGLRGAITLKRFNERVKDPIAQYSLDQGEQQHLHPHMDLETQDWLKRAAEAFTLGLLYAQLYSPRSSSITTLYDRLYSSLKKFNPVELEDFYHYAREQRRRFPVVQVKSEAEDFSNLELFLTETMGVSDQILESR